MEIHSTRAWAGVQRHWQSNDRASTIVPSGLGVWLRLHSLKHSIGSSPTVLSTLLALPQQSYVISTGSSPQKSYRTYPIAFLIIAMHSRLVSQNVFF